MMGNQFTPERAEHENQKRRELERRFAEWLERQPDTSFGVPGMEFDDYVRLKQQMFSAFRAGAECQ